MITGSCLCGDVHFTINAPLGPVTGCHCTQCRKVTGHHSAAVPTPWDTITITGTPKWFNSSATARRGFCGRCGSYLFWEEYDGLVYISAGVLDGETGLHMDGHIFYGDKGDYYRVGEVLPCYKTGRSGPEVTP